MMEKPIYEKRICPECKKERSMWNDDKECFECRDKKRIAKLGKEVVEEGESYNEDEIICPWCGADYGTDDMQESTDCNCYECDKKFHVDIEYSASYSTSKLQAMQEIK